MLERRTPLKRTAFKPRDPQKIGRELIERAKDLSAVREALRLTLVASAPRLKRGVIARVSQAVVAVPKQPREQCPHLLEMARSAPCLFWFIAGCRGSDGSTTVKAHDNRLTANKGKGLKAHDWASVDACEPCHTAYDQGNKHTREQKDAAFDEAFARQMQLYRAIVASPLAKPKDKAAAQWALDRFENKQQTRGTLS